MKIDRNSRRKRNYSQLLVAVFGLLCFSAGYITDWVTENAQRVYDAVDISGIYASIDLPDLPEFFPPSRTRPPQQINCASPKHRDTPYCLAKREEKEHIWFTLSRVPKGKFPAFALHENTAYRLKQQGRLRTEELK